MPLVKRLKDKITTPISQSSKRTTPLWSGPSGKDKMGGITFSMLSRFLTDRERFRLHVIEGIRPAAKWDHLTGYGNMWHCCEEALAGRKDWQAALTSFTSKEIAQYPLQQETITHWYYVCGITFPLYVDYWKKHPDVVKREPIYQEKVFDVLYTLPSGRIVRLRGKWDAWDLIIGDGLYLQEDKSKGQVDKLQLDRQLTFDLQTMLYLVSFGAHLGSSDIDPKWKRYMGKIKGVRYNVVRRPLSGGLGSIKQHKPSKKNPRGETKDHFYGRLSDIISENSEQFFMRWKVAVRPNEILAFRRRTLDPLLEQLCMWYDWVTCCGTSIPDPWADRNGEFNILHWQHPFGVRNILNEGGATDLDEYITKGSMVGLRVVDKLFTELEEV